METATPAQNTEIPKGPKDRPAATPAAPAKRKQADDLVTVAYQGKRAMPMKYEVYADGSMTKLRFGAGMTAKVTREVADVLTGKTPTKREGKRPINSVEVLGTILDASGERWVEVG